MVIKKSKCNWIIKKNPNKIDWYSISFNKNVIELLKEYPDKFYWDLLSSNPSIFEIIYNYDYVYLKSRMLIHFEDICIKVFHPKNEGKLWSIYGYF